MVFFKKIALVMALVVVLGACAGLIVHMTTDGSQAVVKRPAEGGGSSVDDVDGVQPEGIYLFLTEEPVCGFSLEIDGTTVIQNSHVSGISSLVGDYYAVTSTFDDGIVYLLPFDGVKLTIGGEKDAEDDSFNFGDLKSEAPKSGYPYLECWVFYFDGTFDTYSARQNDTPVEISLSDNVQFVCVTNEHK